MPSVLVPVPRLRQQDRTLIRMGQETSTIRDESAPLINNFLQKIKTELSGNDTGGIFVY